ncbi:MAG TPA: hypothetical protein DCY24_02015 [Rikenellaceae bacterium]|nr:hypothetical protein [Rikenellaceae bacterium]
MTSLITFLILLELSILMVYDLRINRCNRSERYALRLMSSAGGLALILTELVLPRPLESSEMVVDLSFVTAILVMCPCSFEKPDTSLKATVCLLLFDFLTLLCFGCKPPGALDFRCQRVVCSFVPMLLFVLLYFLYMAYRRFSGIRAMFRNTAVWHNVEEYSRFLYSIAFMATGMLFLSAMVSAGHMKGILSAVSLIMFLALYAVLYLRAMTGRTFVLKPATEKRIKDIIKGNLRTSYIEKAEEDRKMNNLYKRVVMYMEEKRPYLDQTFDMTSLADLMFTNKLYLSKTINILSGRNFRQFVNYYRVRRAMELFKEDPRLKIGEVSEMSGFHSSVSFNMSFKVNTGKTPTEWLQAYIEEHEKQ